MPDATLRIFYGWNYYDIAYRGNSQMMQWKWKIIEKAKQPGIVFHGRVGQKQLAEEWLKSDIFLYPPPHDFRETSCISAMEAQAAGVLCFYRMNGALGETVGDRGIALPLDSKPEDIIQSLTSNILCYRNNFKYLGEQYTLACLAGNCLVCEC